MLLLARYARTAAIINKTLKHLVTCDQIGPAPGAGGWGVGVEVGEGNLDCGQY